MSSTTARSKGKHRRHQLKDGDVLLPIFGVSGSGRTTFIDGLLPDNESHRPILHPGGSWRGRLSPEAYVLRNNGLFRNADFKKLPGRLVLVDTPGFDLDGRNDQCLAEVLSYLHDLTSEKELWLAGAIFMVNASTEAQYRKRAAELMGRFHRENESPSLCLVLAQCDPGGPSLESVDDAERFYRRYMWPNAPDDVMAFRTSSSEPATFWTVVDTIVQKYVEHPPAAKYTCSPPSIRVRRSGSTNTFSLGWRRWVTWVRSILCFGHRSPPDPHPSRDNQAPVLDRPRAESPRASSPKPLRGADGGSM